MINDTEDTTEYREMTNDEYRKALQEIFENVHENYKLKWFYRFIVEKLRSSH